MRTKLLVLMAVLALAMVALAGDKAAWFDMENCGFCKNLVEDPEMLNHCDWEHHKISDGVMMVTTVQGPYLEAYKKAMAKMNEAGEKMAKGEEVKMCGMCTAMGNLMMGGATWEYAETKHGSVGLLRSADAAVVEKIHAFTDRTTKEMAMMEGAQESHEGHQH